MSASVVDVLLVEYEQLKKEQNARIRTRDNLLYVLLVALGGAVTLALGASRPGAWLLVPPVAMILGWTYLINDQKITDIGDYVNNTLRKSIVSNLCTHQAYVFAWEDEHRVHPRRRVWKFLQLAVDLVAFCVLPVGALLSFSASQAAWTPWYLGALAEFIALGTLAHMFLLHSDVGWWLLEPWRTDDDRIS